MLLKLFLNPPEKGFALDLKIVNIFFSGKNYFVIESTAKVCSSLASRFTMLKSILPMKILFDLEQVVRSKFDTRVQITF